MNDSSDGSSVISGNISRINLSDGSSVISGDISRINLSDDPVDNPIVEPDVNNNSEEVVNVDTEHHKQAWDNMLMKDSTDDSAADDFPFFLKEIDISSEILKSDPNDVQVNNNTTNKPPPAPVVSKIIEPHNVNKFSKTLVEANISDLQERDALQNPLEKEEEEEDKNMSRVHNKRNNSKIDDSKSNAVELAAQSLTQRKNSPFKRESTGGSSVTITNSVNSNYTTSQSRESSAGEGYASNIRVVVRVRPLSLAERQRGDKQCITFSGGGGIQVEGPNLPSKGFTFNSALSEECTQQHVFQESGIQNLIDKALDGFSCTVFAFGPTGSGKTHTIIGPSEQSIEDMLGHQEVCGLVLRSFGYLFEATQKISSVQYIIKASFLEVYNEKVKDLLNPSNAYDSLPVRWSSKKGFYVENLFCVECETSQDLMTLLVEGSNYRQVGVHAINEHSSRSHTIFTVYLEAEDVDSDDDEGFPVIRHGKISFIDLAGSERVKETKTKTDAIAESNNINKSLLALGNCISALGDPKKRGSHIPYRDSKLTKLLADSLGGEGYTLMIACISPSSQNCQDTMNALRYANRAKDIKNKPMVKMDPKEQLLHRMKREIKLLRTENNYFRQQQGVPCSESQVIITPNDIDGELTPNSSGMLSPAIGSGTLSSLHSSRNNSSKELNLTHQTALYALGAKNGLYDILKEYMNENENLKAENMELHRSRALAHRQQEESSRENERLTRKLDELGRVMLASPISRENIRVWINEGNDGSEIFSPSTAGTTSPVKVKSSKVKFPPVRKGSYPNYVTVDLSEEVEYGKEQLYASKDQENTAPESKEVAPSGPSHRRKAPTGTEKNSEEVEKSTSEKKPNSDLSLKSNTNSHSNAKQNNKNKVNKSSNKNSLHSGEHVEKENGNVNNRKNKESVEKIIEDKKENNENLSHNAGSKKDTKMRKNYHSRPWKGKRKPMSVEKPSSYAAQFAARKGLLPRHSMQSERQSVISDGNHMQSFQTSQVGSVLISSQPSPYGYIEHTPYMNTPIYNYNAAYPYSYMGLTPHLHGLPMNIYENMTNQLQQDLQSLNGQLRSDVGYNNNRHKKPQPPR